MLTLDLSSKEIYPNNCKKNKHEIFDNFNFSPIIYDKKLIMLGALNIYVFDIKSNNLKTILKEGIL